MNIRQTSNRGLVLSLLVTASMITLALMQRNIGIKLVENEQLRLVSHMVAEQLRGNFNERSLLIRSYLVTANPETLRQYQEFMGIQRILQPQLIADDKTDATHEFSLVKTKEWARLRDNLAQVGALVKIEKDAIALLASGRAQEAIQVLNSDAYYLAQAKVLQPINEFVAGMDYRCKQAAERLGLKEWQLIKNYGWLLFVILAAMLIEFVSRKKNVITPIEELTRIARSMVDGDYRQRANIDTDNEISLLATTFNEMANSIEQDIKHRKNMKEALANERDRLQAILDGVHSRVFIKDIEGRHILVNTFFERFFNINRRDVIGKTDLDILPEEIARKIMKIDNEVMTSGKATRFEMPITRHDGTENVQLTEKFPLIDLQGKIYGLCGFATDITHQKKIERALQKSEERFALTTAGSGDGLWDFDLPGESFWYSDRFRELLGYENEKDYPNLLESWSDGLHPEDKAATLAAFESHLEQGTPYNVEYRLLTKQGEWRWFNARGKSLRDENGRAYRAAGSITDIHERKKLEADLIKNQERVTQAAEVSQFGFWELDLQILEYVLTDSFWRLFGTSAEKEGGFTLTEQVLMERFIPPEDVHLHEAHLQAALIAKDVSPRSLETRFIRVDGEIRHGLAQYQIIFDQEGNPTKAYGSFHDFTERKKIEEDLQARVQELDKAQSAMLNMMDDLDEEKEKAEAATQAKSDFLANMSHEIRTPMNAIIGMSHLALKTDLNKKQRDYINKVHMSAQGLLGIINDILDFSKIEAGKLSVEVIDFDLNEVLSNLSHLVTMKAQERGLELIFNKGADVPTHLKGDPLRLGQILLNLANNAVKFTENGEVEISISGIEVENKEAFLRFAVRDTGIGLTEEQRSNLFQSFQQADTSTTRKYGGTGLGLTISKQLIGMMGGEIGVDSTHGEGSTFWFTARFGRMEKAPKKREIVPETLKGMRTLVVDDNTTFCEVLKNYLQEFTFNVDVAHSGSNALEMINTSSQSENGMYEIIFMDWQMPGMDGIETAKQIQQNSALAKIPKIIMVTGHGREDVMQMADEINLNGFLLKPVTHSVLLDSVMEAFGKAVTGKSKTRIHQSDLPKEVDAIRGARLLLVEDNEINQQVAVELLQDEGFFVDVAENGKLALGRLTNSGKPLDYDVILMDLQMPVMGGIECTQGIRKWEKENGRKKIPIIAMTADAMSGVRKETIDAGMDDYISKPIEPMAFFQTLVKYILPKKRDLHPDYLKKLSEIKKKEEILPFKELPGINVDQGLSRASNKPPLYLKILTKFFTNNQNTVRKIKDAVESGDNKLAQRLAHTVKGVAGTIGAKELQLKADELEKAITTEEKKDLSDLINALEVELKTVIDTLKPFVKDPDQLPENDNKMDAGNLQQLLDLLLKLEPHIKEGDPKQSKALLKEITSHKWPDEISGAIQNIGKQVKRYQYEDAEEIIEDLINHVKEEI